VYMARGAFFILLLSLFFAYLLEPAVTLLHRYSWLGRRSRTWAIVQVYLIATMVLGGIGYAIFPHFVAQMKDLNAAVPQILEDFSRGKSANLEQHGIGAGQQLRIHDWLVGHRDSITHVFERGAASAGYIASSAIWLFAIPILAIFFLRDGRKMADSVMEKV